MIRLTHWLLQFAMRIHIIYTLLEKMVECKRTGVRNV